ncbi:MAG: hypothetical protein MK132_19075 [Lentisphaerales bacterium]|nr:hypothetical protein [Lentisphaerales bacterium]
MKNTLLSWRSSITPQTATKNNDAAFIKTPDIYQKKQLAVWQVEVAELKPKIEEIRSSVNANFDKLLEARKAKPDKVNAEVLEFKKLNGNGKQKIIQNEKRLVSVENDKDKAVFTLVAKTKLSTFSYIELETAVNIANFVLGGISVKVNEKNVRLGSAEATYEQKGFYAKDSLNLKNKEKGWAIAGGTSVEQTAWFKLAKPVQLKPEDQFEITLSFESKHKKHILKAFKIKAGSGSLTTEDLLVSELINKNQIDLDNEEKAKVVEFLMKKSVGAKVVARHAELSKKVKSFKPATTPIMQDLPKDKRRVTRIFNRGSWEDLGDVVTEGVPEIFNEFKDEWPRNRLGMAK